MVALRERLRPLAPYLVALLWLAAGYANLVRGAAHPGVPYRPWSFEHHSYSDLLAMGGDRYFHGGRPFPYTEDRIEYPPLLGFAVWAASFAPGGPAGYFTAGYLLLGLSALAAIRLLRAIPGTEPWWYAATPALAYYTGLNWDQLPIALLLLALAAHLRGRHAGAGAAAALGVSAKLFPVVLLPPAVAALAGARRWRPLAASAAAFAAVFLSVNLPVALAAPAGWAWFWTYNAGRGAENSLWEAVKLWPSLAPLATNAPLLNALTGGLLALAAAFAAWGAFAAPEARRARAVRLGAALLLVTWVTANKVWSPQYFLYAFAAAALAAAPFRLFWPLSLLAAVDYHVAFEVRSTRGIIRYLDAAYTGEELVRTLLFLLLLGWVARELWRAARRAEPAA